MSKPVIVVISSLFPSERAPFAGLFIRERMFRVAAQLPLMIVSPKAWSPLDWLVRVFRPAFRPGGVAHERMDGIDVFRPRYFSLPGLGKRFDGYQMAGSISRLLRQQQASFRPVLLDAHFLYPDGYAASIAAQALRLPLTVTIRGSKDQRLIGTSREFGLRRTLARATRVLAVSELLKQTVAIPMGAAPEKVSVVGNGVNLEQFFPEDKLEARTKLGLPSDASVMLTVGNLIGLKGFHRVVALLPRLRKSRPKLHYLIVGGSAGSDSVEPMLRKMVAEYGLEDYVHFCGPIPPTELRWYYSAADLFVLATEYEGWANVLLESIACATPVVTTRVGGNAQVVASEDLGLLCPYWDADEFAAGIERALRQRWNANALLAYAAANSWEAKISPVVQILADASSAEPSTGQPG